MRLSTRSRPSPVTLLVALALVFAMVGTAVAAPDALTRAVSKSKVKKIAKKQANKQIKKKAPGLSVNNAANLGGEPASAYQREADLLFATVAPAGAGAAIVHGRGATSVTQLGTGFFRVTFNRSVADCTWTASYGPPTNETVDPVFATVGGNGGATPNQVGVVLFNPDGTQVDCLGFHLAVLCP